MSTQALLATDYFQMQDQGVPNAGPGCARQTTDRRGYRLCRHAADYARPVLGRYHRPVCPLGRANVPRDRPRPAFDLAVLTRCRNFPSSDLCQQRPNPGRLHRHLWVVQDAVQLIEPGIVLGLGQIHPLPIPDALTAKNVAHACWFVTMLRRNITPTTAPPAPRRRPWPQGAPGCGTAARPAAQHRARAGRTAPAETPG